MRVRMAELEDRVSALEGEVGRLKVKVGHLVDALAEARRELHRSSPPSPQPGSLVD